jgi:uncharacterized membrane protein
VGCQTIFLQSSLAARLISPISSTVLSILLTILLNIVACPINPQNNRAIPADARTP